jgi:hypothetical protein
MDSVIPFRAAPSSAAERDLVEIDAAIALVVEGHARRVRLVGLADPEAVAPVGLARAQVAGVGFRMVSNGDPAVLTFGPRE